MNWKFCALLLIIALLAPVRLQPPGKPLSHWMSCKLPASSTAPSEADSFCSEKSEPPTELPL